MPLMEYLTNDEVNEQRAHTLASRLGIDLLSIHRPESTLKHTVPHVILDLDNLNHLGFDIATLLERLAAPGGQCRVRAAHSYFSYSMSGSVRSLRKRGVPVFRKLSSAMKFVAKQSLPAKPALAQA